MLTIILTYVSFTLRAYRRSYIFRQSETTLICEFAAGGAKSTAANTSKGAMVHFTHSAVHWRRRCINDMSSEDEENTPPNIQPSQQYDRVSKRRVEGDSDSASATGTATPPWLPPERSRPKSKAATNPPPSQKSTSAPVSPPMPSRPYSSPTTSSPVLLETPPRSPARPRTNNALQLRHEGRRARREASAPYARRQSAPQRDARPVINPRGAMRVTADESPRAQLRGPRPRDRFIPAQWPYRVIHLREQFNPLATVFPSVPHFGWRDCQSPCRFCQVPSSSPPPRLHPPLPMPKHSGTTNYSMADADRLLALVEKMLPLGRDESERFAMTFNANRPRGSPERDFERLRLKFKVLHSTRKPTGVQEMPPLVKKAKETKCAIDDKANVVEMDDEADNDQPDFCFEVDPDDSFYEDGEGEGLQVPTTASVGRSGCCESPSSDESAEDESTASSRSSGRGAFQDLLTLPLTTDDLDELARTPRPAPVRAAPNTRRAGSGGMTPPRKTAATAPSSDASQQPPTQGAAATTNRDAAEAAKYPKLHKTSNRLGGVDLAGFRDTVGAKRAHEEDKDTMEASYAKAKRIRAMKATTALKTKLDGLENNATNMRGGILETLLLLCEESERKADAHRAEEDQRRRDEKAANEARLLEAKAEAEARRREEKLEREERARREREDARARTQELLILIGALTKKPCAEGAHGLRSEAIIYVLITTYLPLTAKPLNRTCCS
ncbi:hypothetical protein PF007_g16458 [Phytophthora fragariae]|uniref:DUF6818 domain-containing protein n=1 Tax=Phytophthora fragariae TaxID=53985 RepID=A0A6A3RPS0_9STRA|nr:hypothetical protein PF007_g16458 [Phytophthora fragariae]